MADSAYLVKADGAVPFHSWHSLAGGRSSSTSSNGAGAASLGHKVLPALPDMDTQMALAAKMIDRRTSTPRGNHTYGPFFTEYTLLAEYNLLKQHALPGVYVIPAAKTPLCWFGVIFVRQGMYQEGVFRFKLVIPDNYPDGDCPRVIFEQSVYHPLVDPSTFELDVRKAFSKWKRNVHHIWQVLHYVRRIFYKVEAKDAVNVEAAQLLTGDPAAFTAQARKCVSEWSSRVMQASASPDCDDPHYITFAPFDESLHAPFISAIRSNDRDSEVLGSLSSHSSRSRTGTSFLESSQGSVRLFAREAL